MTTTATLTDPQSYCARAHCASRLLERYGMTRYAEACRLYDRHSSMLERGMGTQLYTCPDGSRIMRLHDRGKTYHPVLKLDPYASVEIIVTYLSETMVQGNLERPPPW